MSVCLDAFAMLSWLQDAAGAHEVEEYLTRAAEDEQFNCYLSTINLGEVFYRLVRVRNLEEAEAFWEEVRRGNLPVKLVEPTRNRVREAARIKGQYPVAFADAFAAQTAREKAVPLVTGDPELKILADKGMISLLWLGPA
ncbi:MAG: type II toxin-antitoxin system VapC family toxin [Deltaproteobacteria bacterium]|nr:type II toxin-antitoxin system VapC family toxin [Deltaproteobacteria bacterium]MBW2071529.1 type II toxin-antitoxin system VapC family toxin [Deltaproteobacteria bacterium]